MTEAEWLARTDPAPMLEFLRGRASDRKLRLFGVACCRRGWENLTDPKARRALELVERAADGSDIRVKLGRASIDLADILYTLEQRYGEFGYVCDYQWRPTQAVQSLFDRRERSELAPVSTIWSVPYFIIQFVRECSIAEYQERDEIAEKAVLSRILRDICGNPFCSVTADPRWITSTAVALTQAIYADRAFDRLPILADALEEAGCDQPDLLAHCRGDGPHVRGCWVVDLILGKE
jgi:hypothetical protein